VKTSPVFPCPSCDEPVEGKGDYVARGLKCPDCNTGFIPVKVELKRPIGVRKNSLGPAQLVFSAGAIILLGSGIALFIPGMVFGGFVAVIGAVLLVKK
jgi:hypothetical protein